MNLNFMQILSAFVVLFVLIDVLGSVPLFLNFKKNGDNINAFQAAVYSFFILVAFLPVFRIATP
jgi:multiple antibiotic resistance protein